ncbi:MAG: hypothetical protein DHS20C02_01200 [Micavibrio sp.]|nr:MAG: hypothetical protein DHS20C02_01200 [Micavibrio sp.]
MVGESFDGAVNRDSQGFLIPSDDVVKDIIGKLYRGEPEDVLETVVPEKILEVREAAKDIALPLWEADIKKGKLSVLMIAGTPIEEEQVDALLSGGDRGKKVAGLLKNALRITPDHKAFKTYDTNNDGEFTVDDFKVDSPELRQAILDNYNTIKARAEGAQAIVDMVGENGLYKEILVSTIGATTDRVMGEIDRALKESQSNYKLVDPVPESIPDSPKIVI